MGLEAFQYFPVHTKLNIVEWVYALNKALF